MSDVDDLIALEQSRCEAISKGDIETLDCLLADDLSHTHISGKTDDKPAYLEGLLRRPRVTTRGHDLRVQVYGDVAVMTGKLENDFAPAEQGEERVVIPMHALQVWLKRNDTWRQIAFASSGSRPGA